MELGSGTCTGCAVIANTAAMVVNAQQISSSRILDSYQRRTPHSEEVGVSSEYHKETAAM